MGCTFEQTRKRSNRIKIGEEIIQLIKDMKSLEIKMRPSIDKTIEILIRYCERKKYTESFEFIPALKDKKNSFIQTPFNEKTSSLRNNLLKEELLPLLSKKQNVVDFNIPIFSPENQFEKKIVNGIDCFLIDSKAGRFDILQRSYFYNQFTFNLNSFDYPFVLEQGKYIYLADIETNTLIKYKN